MSNDFPTRHVKVLFTSNGLQLKEVVDLNVNFNIKKYAHSAGAEANISIANLAMSDITYLTTALSPFEQMNNKKKIALFAGYDDDINKIFEGCVCSAQPSRRGGDIWLDIQANKNFFNSCTMTSKSLIADDKKPMPIKDVCQKIADWAKLALDWKAKINKNVDAFSFTGSVTDAIRKVNDLGLIYAFEDSNKLRVLDKNPLGNVVKKFSKSSGLIEIPRLTQFGVDIRALLDSSIKVGDRVAVESELVPSANGQYWVYALNYVGSLRGTEFYVELNCRRNQM